MLCLYTQCTAHMLKGYSNKVFAFNLAWWRAHNW